MFRFDEVDLVEFEMKESGNFNFFLISGDKCYKTGFIQIPPKFLHQDNIKLITLVSKWMGSVNNWEKYYETIKGLGYNMIHFTPLQQRGISNSPYSIKDQLKLSDDLFEDKLKVELELELEHSLKLMNEKFQIFGMTDIVWNHTACDSEWLIEHPEAGYNLDNSPHLKSAYALDESILKFSSILLSTYGISGELKDENDLLEMMKVFKFKHLPKYRLWEFFVIDVSSSERKLEKYIETPVEVSANRHILIKSLKDAENNDGKWDRFSNGMNLDAVISFYSKQIESIRTCDQCERDHQISLLLADYRYALDQLNLKKYQEFDEIIEIACRNIYARAQYERISEHGPRLGKVSQRYVNTLSVIRLI